MMREAAANLLEVVGEFVEVLIVREESVGLGALGEKCKDDRVRKEEGDISHRRNRCTIS